MTADAHYAFLKAIFPLSENAFFHGMAPKHLFRTQFQRYLGSSPGVILSERVHTEARRLIVRYISNGLSFLRAASYFVPFSTTTLATQRFFFLSALAERIPLRSFSLSVCHKEGIWLHKNKFAKDMHAQLSA